MNPTGRNVGEPVEEILEECRQRLARGGTIESCLAAYPARAAELAPLLSVLVQARGLARDPDPRYAAAARRRFQAALATAKQNRGRAVARSGRFAGWLTRLAVPLALVLILSLSGLGLVQASDGSLPDSPLYPVKQASENVGGLLATSPPARAVFQIRLTNARRSELERAMAMKKSSVFVLMIAQAMVNAANQATDQALQNQGQTHDEVIAHLRPLLTAEQHDLGVIAGDSRPQLASRGHALQQQIAADEQKLAGQ